MVVLAAGSRPRGTPYPAHCRLGGIDLPLAYLDRRGAALVAVVPPDQFNVAPDAYGEQAKNPAFGAIGAMRDLTRGMGQRRARLGPNGRYWYALGARARSGRVVLGPQLTLHAPATADTTTGITRWFEVGGGIHALNGRYALSGGTTGTGWAVSKDFGSGKAATDVVVLQDNHTGSTRYALAAMGDSENVWYFDGATATTTWTQHASWKARAWALDPTTLYYVNDTNRLNTVDLEVDVLTLANHAAATDRIGTKDHAVTRMKINALGSLVVAKADDLYTLNPEGSWNRLFEALQFPPASTNGAVLTRWGNDDYVVYGNAFFRLGPDGGLSWPSIGPEALKDNGSEVRGYVTAAVGTDYFLLAGLYNPDTGASYLLEFAGELVPDEQGRPEPVWHGSICEGFAGKRITSLHTSTIGAPSGHKLAYVGFSDATIATYVLACTPDPADCTSERFATTGTIYHSRVYLGAPSEQKALLSAAGEADNWSSATYGTLLYRTNGVAAYTEMASVFDAGERQVRNFPTATSCVYLDTALRLTTTAATASPQVSGLSVLYQTRPTPQDVMRVAVPAAPGQRKRDGTPYRLGTAEIATYLDSLAGSASAVSFDEPNGNAHTVFVKTPQRTTAFDAATRAPVDAYVLELVEQAPTLAYSTLADLETLTLAQWDQYLLVGLEDI